VCGIAGIFEYDANAAVSADVVARMCQVIEHRGPDDQRVYCNGQIGLGARRLSIIDLATGGQPLSNEDQTVWVAFNGEIYNFLELRPGLEAKGHRFASKTDTEVIVHLYEEYGLDFVRHLRGMFAIALWDARARKLVLVRDRLGIKPLYYWPQTGQLLFGSELKCLLAAPGARPSVDLESLNSYISLGYCPDPDSIFAGVHKLPPGHMLIVQPGSIEDRQYWELPWPDESAPPSEQEACERLRELMLESVKLRLISDVPLGAMLSGGFDSSTVVALMSRLMDRPVKTFSIGFPEKDFSELDYARQVAKHLGTEHHELVVEPKAVELVTQLMGYFDEPFGDPSAVPTFLVSQLARKSVTVALSGDGGDELFAGYDRYREARRQQAFDLLPRTLRKNVLMPLSERLPYRMYGKNYLRRIALEDGFERYMDAAMMQLPVKRRLLSSEFTSHVRSLDSSAALRQAIPNGHGHGLLDRLIYLDTKSELPGDILTKVDRMSMGNSLEVRVPILDHKVVEYVARLPMEYKLRGKTTKYLFKKAFGNLLPPDILTRPKMGFELPLQHWFARDMRDFLRDALFDSRARQRGYFNERFVDELAREHESGRRDNSYLLWRLLSLEIWHRHAGL
jgi:asparagine synthase (glutamine-hydrolysing)